MEAPLTCWNLQGYFSRMQIGLHQFHAAGVLPLSRWRLPLRKLNDRLAPGRARRNFTARRSLLDDISCRLSDCVDTDLAGSW